MRSLLVFGLEKVATPAPMAGSGRLEALRRRMLEVGAKLILASSLACAPLAVYGLIHGTLLPFIVVMIALATGTLTLALHHRGLYEQSAAGQVYGTLLVGLLLALADPMLADFGLATALLAPVHAALLGQQGLKRRSWIGLAVVVVLSALSLSGVPVWIEPFQPEFGFLGMLSFAVSAGVVAHSATRMNAVFEVYDKTQVNAYRHLIEHVQDAVMRFSGAGELLFVSRSAEDLFGCRRYELTGSTVGERIHVLDRPAYLTAFADANQDGHSRTIEVRMRKDDPSVKVPQFLWVEATLSPVIENADSQARYEVVALFRDVTARKDAENEMREARRVAEDASTAKSRFLATIGHELRTPLNAIVGFSEMMTSSIGGELSPTHREYAKLIHQSGSHLIDVVKTLLDMSRLEAGKFELHTDSFAPAVLVEPCLKMVDQLARDRQVTISADIPAHLPAIVADERVCRQVLINLLSNAIKFSHEGGTVRVTMKRQGQYLNLSVIDQGIGMTPEAVSRVGEAFYQAHDGLSRRYEGTGLGLSIVKGLVELHDGSLKVMSEPGVGTTMTVLLPVNGPAIKVDETATVTPLRREPAEQISSTWPEQKRNAL